MEPADPVNPQRIFHELSPRLPNDVILTADSGSVANWYARDIRIRRGMMGSLSGGLASLGAAAPYALAAKMAYPHRPVIGSIGDGAMQMNGLNVMITAGKYWRRCSNPRFILMVLNNEDLNQVTWEERVQLDDGKTPLTQTIPDFPYHEYAELLGSSIEAIGAHDMFRQEDDTCHLGGTARMGSDPRTSVVNAELGYFQSLGV